MLGRAAEAGTCKNTAQCTCQQQLVQSRMHNGETGDDVGQTMTTREEEQKRQRAALSQRAVGRRRFRGGGGWDAGADTTWR